MKPAVKPQKEVRKRRPRFGVEAPMMPMSPDRRFECLKGLLSGTPVSIPHVSAYFYRVLDPKRRPRLEAPSMIDACVLRIYPPSTWNSYQARGATKPFEAFERMLIEEFKALNAGKGELRESLLRARIKIFIAQIIPPRRVLGHTKKAVVLTHRVS